MGKQGGNPNWYEPEDLNSFPGPTSEFERVARALKLKPNQYRDSERLHKWAEQHRRSR